MNIEESMVNGKLTTPKKKGRLINGIGSALHPSAGISLAQVEASMTK